MSDAIRLELTLEELHETIAQSIREALAATGHRIVGPESWAENEKIRELGRNAAACLQQYQVIE